MTTAPQSRKVSVATAWLDGCSGCHMSVLDLDEVLLTLAGRIQVVFGPLVDAQEYPESVDLALVEGAVSNQDDFALIHKIRAHTNLVVALGDCAVTSNVPSMRNSIPVSRLLERVYLQNTEGLRQLPTIGVPTLARHAVPLHEVIKIDVHIPGCPPPPAIIASVLMQVLDGRRVELPALAKFG
jgi:NAD-reducing hydrogenase small subunit